MTELERVIANLGYPVGMGMAPSPADLARMKSAVIEECARVAETYAKHLWPTAIPRSEFVAAIRALKDKP